MPDHNLNRLLQYISKASFAHSADKVAAMDLAGAVGGTPSGRAEELIACLEAEIVKRDARIAELEEHVKKFIGLTDAFQVLAKVDQSINDRNSRLMKLEQQRGGVALPERKPWRTLGQATQVKAEGWNECLDAIAALAGSKDGDV